MALLQRRGIVLGSLAAFSWGCHVEGTSARADAVRISPSEDAALLIQEALNQGFIVMLDRGTYELPQALHIPSGTGIVGAGSDLTVLHPTWQVGPEDADLPENAVISAAAVRGTAVLTTLAASATKDSLYLELTSAGDAAGDWLEVQGNNAAEDEYEMAHGPSVILTEIVKVSSYDANGVVLAMPTRQFHAVGTEVRSIMPVTDIVVSGVDIRASGTGIATGILLDGVVDADLQDVKGSGFSRSLVEVGPGTSQVNLQRLWSAGENNALVLATSAMSIRLESFGSSPDGLRCHEHGVPRGMVTFRSRCTGVVVTDGDLATGCIGLRVWGGQHMTFSDIAIRDMHNEQAILRDPEVAGFRVGVGVDTGAGPLEIAEFAFDVTFDGIHLENCRQTTLQSAAWYLHDLVAVSMSNCTISNKGENPWTEGRQMTGLLASDCTGTIESLTVRGVLYGFRTANVLAYLNVGSLDIFGAPADGMAGAYGLHLEHGSTGAGPTIARLRAENVPAFFMTGPTFKPDWLFRVTEYRCEGFEANDLVIAKNVAPTMLLTGEVVELQTGPLGERNVTTSSGPSTKNAIVATGRPGSPGTGYVLITAAPVSRCHVRCTTAAVEIGDLMVASATSGRAESNNAPENPFHVLGKALTAKNAGAEGMVLLGPA